MDSEYMTQIENSNLESRLLRTDNIPVLEELLNRDSQRLEKLQKLKEDNKLDMGNKITTKELKELFPKICTEVDDFLGIQSKDLPKVGYNHLFKLKISPIPILSFYTFYTYLMVVAGTSLINNQNLNTTNLIELGVGVGGLVGTAYLHSLMKFKGSSYIRYLDTDLKEVILEKTPRTELIPAMGHEYTHHVQLDEGVIDKGGHHGKYLIFKEGHARGVERHLSEDYREREDNEAFLYHILNRNIREFKSAYVWMCSMLSKPVRDNLLRTKALLDNYEYRILSSKRKPSLHATGNALFSIYEALHGKQVYNHMIHGDFKFS